MILSVESVYSFVPLNFEFGADELDVILLLSVTLKNFKNLF
jgi:hypothetical protein